MLLLWRYRLLWLLKISLSRNTILYSERNPTDSTSVNFQPRILSSGHDLISTYSRKGYGLANCLIFTVICYSLSRPQKKFNSWSSPPKRRAGYPDTKFSNKVYGMLEPLLPLFNVVTSGPAFVENLQVYLQVVNFPSLMVTLYCLN